MMKRRKSGNSTRALSDDFRREAVRLVEAGTKPIVQIARELNVDLETLRNWRRKFGTPEAGTADGRVPVLRRPTVASMEAEVRRLERENAQLKEEREILKKATAFFAKDAR